MGEIRTGSPIWELDLTDGTVTFLTKNGIYRIGDLLKRVWDGCLIELSHIGPIREHEIVGALRASGFEMPGFEIVPVAGAAAVVGGGVAAPLEPGG